jgi:hypothetical protein
MRQLDPRAFVLALTLSGMVAFSSCNNAGGAKAPRLSTIPLQSVSGGSTFTLDLSTYVTDDTVTATYAVTSGGGSFSGSVYSKSFETLGTYTVDFKVTDFRGKVTTGSFQVKVTSAVLAIVKEGSGVSYFDVQGSKLMTVFQNDGRTKTYKAALSDGCTVFEVTDASQTDLYLWDPSEKILKTISADSTKNETYACKTSDKKICYQKGSSPNRSLHLYDPSNEGTTDFTASNGESRDEKDAVVDSADLIYFESAKNGLSDIYSYNPSTSKVVAISTHARDEDIVAVLPNDALLFRRKGDGGEWDLFYYKSGTGVVEVGSDLDGSSPFTESKTFKGRTTNSRVIFETSNGSDIDLYIWNPSTGQTTAIATSGVDETFQAVGDTNLVIYKIATSSSNGDLSYFDPSAGSSTSVGSSSDDEAYNGSLSNGDIIFTRDTGGNGKDLYVYDVTGSSATAFPSATTTATDYVFAKILSNDHVVYTISTSIYLYNATAGTTTNITTSTGTETYAGETSGGDFVISLNDGSQTDLYLWDESASSAVAISTTAGNDSFQSGTSTGQILFSRVASGSTTSELYVWNPSDLSETKITTNSANDSVETVISASVN